MIRQALPLLLFAAVTFVSGIASAQPPESAVTPGGSTGAARGGTVHFVNPSNNQLTIRDALGVSKTHRLREDARITDGTNALTIADIRPGDIVSISTDDQGLITSVTVAPSGD